MTSPKTDLARQPELRLSLDNDALFQVAENLIYLRRHRKLTQANLAKKMGTSQAKVARIEGGRENVTLRTLQKAVVALEGRLSLSVSPAELEWPKAPSWWSEADEAHSSYRLQVPHVARGARKSPAGPRRGARTRR
jgi:transcriptional regulator with XRE-family HTH domain